VSPRDDSPDDRSAKKPVRPSADKPPEDADDKIAGEANSDATDEAPAAENAEQPVEARAGEPEEKTETPPPPTEEEAEPPPPPTEEASEPRLARKNADAPTETSESGKAGGKKKNGKQKQPQAPTDASAIGALAEQFRVIGEIRGHGGARRFVALRNDDHREVVIDIVKASGDAGNDAAHLAADVQLRSTMSHPRVQPVIEGRWLNGETYAYVSERVKGDTLQERLDRGDRPGTAEVATILSDVKAVLDWAREGGVVHRGVTPDSITIEQDTNHLLVSLGNTPIPLTGLPRETADAKTLAALAWSLFTGRRFVDDDSRPSLAELCPNLAARVVDSVERILRAKPNDRAPDAAAFIGIVAVGDVLKQAEVEFAALDEEFASHFTGEAIRDPRNVPPERLLAGRPPGTRESIVALSAMAALVLLIALGVGLAARAHRANAPIVAQRMPTVPAAGIVDSVASPRRNDSILTHSAAGTVADSVVRIQDSVLRDSITRDRMARGGHVRDSVVRDSLDHVNTQRDSLDEETYRRDSIRAAIREQSRRDSMRQDSIRRELARSDSLRIDSLRNDALRQDSLRRDAARRDSIRRDSVRPDTITRRPDTVRPDTTRTRPPADTTRPPPDTIALFHDSRRTAR
jgi:serine/threonine protein kinase